MNEDKIGDSFFFFFLNIFLVGFMFAELWREKEEEKQ